MGSASRYVSLINFSVGSGIGSVPGIPTARAANVSTAKMLFKAAQL
jgi:hypothetical protein